MNTHTRIKIIGLVLLIAGIGLGIWGVQLSDSIGSKVTQVITGAHTDKVMWLYICSAITTVVGMFLIIKK
ncbi:DUF3185 family protein [Marinicellulosiphila megalodicopiae]|uniref:DUF3185 family protein n=1 Tax=Marinicellulosiphila megalodicopiae TaxID=2724896 RepID=UPI003BAE3F2E